MSNNNNNNNTSGIPIFQAELVPDSTNNANLATPNEYFEYNEETMKNDVPIPTAPALNTLEDTSPFAQEHDVSRRARYGTTVGQIHTHREKETIRQQSNKDKSKPYLEKYRIEQAGKIAQQRKREVNITGEDKYFDESGLLSARNGGKSNGNKGNKNSSGEYQVSEYNVEEYDCVKYETTEYKSVYDN